MCACVSMCGRGYYRVPCLPMNKLSPTCVRSNSTPRSDKKSRTERSFNVTARYNRWDYRVQPLTLTIILTLTAWCNRYGYLAQPRGQTTGWRWEGGQFRDQQGILSGGIAKTGNGVMCCQGKV
jgi:hypothetical protein